MTPTFKSAQTSSQEEASKALHEAGIPGIKYLDAGSRGGPSARYIKLQDELRALQDDHAAMLSRPSRGIPPSPDSYIQQSLSKIEAKKVELAAAAPTSNYVIFSPSDLRIIGRNGQRLEPVDHDPFKE